MTSGDWLPLCSLLNTIGNKEAEGEGWGEVRAILVYYSIYKFE